MAAAGRWRWSRVTMAAAVRLHRGGGRDSSLVPPTE